MAQAQIDLIGLIRKCKYCDKTFRSEAGELNHMKRIHPLDMDSDARCWTCNKAFTRRQLLYQHYSTVLHQLNCKKHNEGEIPEKEEKSIESAHSSRSTLKQAKSYRKQLMERSVRFQPYKKKPLCSLRSTPAIIPLEPTCPQADPRTENSLGTTHGSLQSRREESTPKLQNFNELSKFEKEIIEMFEIPENFKEITSSDTLQVDLDLQTSLNLPLEENSLLDLLIDSEIV